MWIMIAGPLQVRRADDEARRFEAADKAVYRALADLPKP
jgi:hypothetical protein